MELAAYQSRARFTELDGYRGIGVLLVIAAHMHDRIWEWTNAHGAMTAFFVISGFIITTLGLREERKYGAMSLAAFYARRVFRILPLYYAVLGIYCLLIFGFAVGAEKASALRAVLVPYLFYHQEVPFFVPEAYGIAGGRNVPFYQTWSLGIEEKFYLLWPLLGFVLWRARGAVRIWGTFGLGLACMVMPVFGHPGECVFPYWNILLGCWLALLLDDPAWHARLARLATPWRGRVVLLLVLGCHFLGARYYELRYPYPLFVCAALVVLLLADGLAQRLLRSRLLVFTGTLSYAMYLVHLLCINAAERVFPAGSGSLAVSISAWLLAAMVSLAAGWGLHALVERPCMEFGRRIAAHCTRGRKVLAAEPGARISSAGFEKNP